jgi:hypothetical protein
LIADALALEKRAAPCSGVDHESPRPTSAAVAWLALAAANPATIRARRPYYLRAARRQAASFPARRASWLRRRRLSPHDRAGCPETVRADRALRRSTPATPPRCTAAGAACIALSFHRGWGVKANSTRCWRSRNTLAHRLRLEPQRPIGFVISRIAADEAEILSVAVERPAQRGRGHCRGSLA